MGCEYQAREGVIVIVMGDSTSATAIILTHWKRLCTRQLALQAASGRTVLKEKEGMS